MLGEITHTKGLEPNVRTFNAMMKGLCQEGLLEDAKELLNKMRECGCYPDSFTYNPIVQCLLKKSEGFGAKLVLEEMLNHRIEPDSYTCSLLRFGMLKVPVASEETCLHVRYESLALWN